MTVLHEELPSEIEQLQQEFGPQGLMVVAIDIKEPEATVTTWVKATSLSPSRAPRR